MITKFINLLRKFRYRFSPSIYWARTEVKNWGDDFNPWLFQKLTGQNPLYCPHRSIPKLHMAGSILQLAGPFDSCWGSGFITDIRTSPPELRHAYALRGLLSAQILESAGIEPPSAFGDPGLLPARLIPVNFTKHYSIAVIPHYADQELALSFCHEAKVELIPVSLGIETFVQKIAAAEMVFSSSLHGIICAESLGISVNWVQFSNNLIGGHFKFHDYLSGTSRDYKNVYPLDARTDRNFFKKKGTFPPLSNDALFKCQSDLLRSFPYKIKKCLQKELFTFESSN